MQSVCLKVQGKKMNSAREEVNSTSFSKQADKKIISSSFHFTK